jgi:hypothetical protein
MTRTRPLQTMVTTSSVCSGKKEKNFVEEWIAANASDAHDTSKHLSELRWGEALCRITTRFKKASCSAPCLDHIVPKTHFQFKGSSTVSEMVDTYLCLTVYLPASTGLSMEERTSPTAIIGRYTGSKDGEMAWIMHYRHPIFFRQLQSTIGQNFIDFAGWELNSDRVNIYFAVVKLLS